MAQLKITAKSLPFRRAGLVFSTIPLVIARGDLKDEQYEALKNEPNLVVEEIDGSGKDDKKAGGKGKGANPAPAQEAPPADTTPVTGDTTPDNGGDTSTPDGGTEPPVTDPVGANQAGPAETPPAETPPVPEATPVKAPKGKNQGKK